MNNSDYKILTQEEIMKSIETTSELKFWTGSYREDMDHFQLYFDAKLKEYATNSNYIGYGGPYEEYLDKAFKEVKYFGFGEPLNGFGYETYIYDLDFYYLKDKDIIKGYVENTLPIINKNEGNIKSYTFYIDGRDFSEIYNFYENGNLKRIYSYHAGKTFEWSENGVLLLEGYGMSSRVDDIFLYRKYNEKGALIDQKTKLTAKEQEEFDKRNRIEAVYDRSNRSPYIKEKLIYYEKELPKTLPDDLNPPNPIINPPLKGEHFIKKMEFFNNSIEEAKKVEAENIWVAGELLKETDMDVNLIHELTSAPIEEILKMKKKFGK